MSIQRFFPLKAVSGLLAALFILALLVGVAQAQQVESLSLQVAAAYQKSFYETVTLMDSIESNLEKMMISGSGAREQVFLSDIARQADAAQDNLATLPVSLPFVPGSIKFINQLGDYTASLNDRLAAGGAVTDEDRALLLTLREHCHELNALLAETVYDIQTGGNPFAQSGSFQSPELPAMDEQVEPAIDYPALLYDGPFSDGRSNGRLQALGTVEYSREQALEKAHSFIGVDRVLSIEVTGEGVTPVSCYEISARVQEGEIEMAVTRQGGEVIYMLCGGTPKEARHSQSELIDLAAQTLKSRGYPQCEVSYWSLMDGRLTVNFAPVQDGVILYPDLIKVEMDAYSGQLVGLEALNYLSNHVTRQYLTPTLTEKEAASLLGPLLTVTRCRLCVIPTDAGETLCYEFSAQVDENEYLVYIDAHTGLEREIYRIIEDGSGQLAI